MLGSELDALLLTLVEGKAQARSHTVHENVVNRLEDEGVTGEEAAHHRRANEAVEDRAAILLMSEVPTGDPNRLPNARVRAGTHHVLDPRHHPDIGYAPLTFHKA